MRVIGGEFRSRRLKTLRGPALRPTHDRLRETLFDVLAPEVPGCTFLDAYAGSGAVGIEALSRGAARVVFLEKSRAAVRVIRENVAALGLGDRAEVVHGETLKRLPRHPAGIVFLDPPYDAEREYGAALRLLGQAPPPLVVAQHSARLSLKDEYGALRRVRVLKQGDNVLSFFRPQEQPPAPNGQLN
ncbi:MAG: 16S rRNA (guanine(966)-N(2))-methyltransferase RsmD [Acidobacteriota bacterium]